MKLSGRTLPPAFRIFLTLLSAIIVASACYFAFITLSINPWLEDNQRELSVLNFYSHNIPSNATDIYFIGTSQVKEGIDCYIIEGDITRTHASVACYNLAVNGDSPLRRLTELDSIIRAKPKIVIIGIKISDLLQKNEIENSRLILLSDKITLDNVSASLFDNDQISLLHLNPVTRDISNRIYIISYLNYMTVNKLIPNSIADYKYRKNFKDPYQDVENTSIEEKLAMIRRDPPANDTELTAYYGETKDKLALSHMVQELRKNNITVIILNMPIDPLETQFISNSTRNNYFSYLDTLGVTYYDFGNRYPSSSFHDFVHMNVQGRTALSHDAAEIITREKEI